MSNITVTYRDGRVAQLEQVYIRGSKIRFLILPDMLKNAPMLKSMKNKNQGSGAGRGKAAILKAQGKLGVCGPEKYCILYVTVYASAFSKHLKERDTNTDLFIFFNLRARSKYLLQNSAEVTCTLLYIVNGYNNIDACKE